MWHKPCRTFHPWCPCIKTRCLSRDSDQILRSYDMDSNVLSESEITSLLNRITNICDQYLWSYRHILQEKGSNSYKIFKFKIKITGIFIYWNALDWATDNNGLMTCVVGKELRVFTTKPPGPRLNIKTVLSTYGDFHVKDKTAVRTSYL